LIAGSGWRTLSHVFDWKLKLGAVPFGCAERKSAVLDFSFFDFTLPDAVPDFAFAFSLRNN
jgi:hypothetical protein